jgi:hypothetical protein
MKADINLEKIIRAGDVLPHLISFQTICIALKRVRFSDRIRKEFWEEVMRESSDEPQNPMMTERLRFIEPKLTEEEILNHQSRVDHRLMMLAWLYEMIRSGEIE